MSNQQINPEKVTKPIQLLAAWLIGLILIDSAFLVAAAQLKDSPYIALALTIAAIINVPLFLICLFLLQTKFRPEMQEDRYYSKYLEYQSTTKSKTAVDQANHDQIFVTAGKIITSLELGKEKPGKEERKESIEKILISSQI